MTFGPKASYWPTHHIADGYGVNEYGVWKTGLDEPDDSIRITNKPLAISKVTPVDNGKDWEATLCIESAYGVRTATQIRFSQTIYPDTEFMPRLRWDGAEIPPGAERLTQRYLIASIAKAIKSKLQAEQPVRIVESIRRYVLANYADIPTCSLDGVEDENPVETLPVIVDSDVLLLSESGLVEAAGEGTSSEIIRALSQAGVLFENGNELNRCYGFEDRGKIVMCHAIFLRALLSPTAKLP